MFSKKAQAGYFGKKKRRGVKITRADKYFSRYIRLNNIVKIVGGIPYCQCITCSKVLELKLIQNGHFIKRNRYNLRFNEQNCQPQCPHCNEVEGGNDYIFGKEIDRKYGAGTADKLVSLGKIRGAHKKMTKYRLDAIAEEYKEKCKKLINANLLKGYFK